MLTSGVIFIKFFTEILYSNSLTIFLVLQFLLHFPIEFQKVNILFVKLKLDDVPAIIPK